MSIELFVKSVLMLNFLHFCVRLTFVQAYHVVSWGFPPSPCVQGKVTLAHFGAASADVLFKNACQRGFGLMTNVNKLIVKGVWKHNCLQFCVRRYIFFQPYFLVFLPHLVFKESPWKCHFLVLLVLMCSSTLHSRAALGCKTCENFSVTCLV